MPRLLDLYCGAGGCGVGYPRAGFEVMGVDPREQPFYPFGFVRLDAIKALCSLLDGEALHDSQGREWFLADVDVIHASPPCKRFTALRAVQLPTLFDPHDDLVTPTRAYLHDARLPYVMENVPGAPLCSPVLLCGSMFGLAVRRHRLFECNWPASAPGACRHREQGKPLGVYGDGGAWTRTRPGGGGTKVAGADAAKALGIDWTHHQPALAQAIPPAYTQHLGALLLNLEPAGTGLASDADSSLI